MIRVPRKILTALLFLLLGSSVVYAYSGPALGSRILSIGMVGGDVQDMQQRLNKIGDSVGSADGIFGNVTKKGVTTFQSQKGISVDGIAGPQTIGLLKKASDTTTTTTTKSLAQVLKNRGISGAIPNVNILVDKSDHILTLYSGSTALKSYHIDLGDNGLDDKVKSGDHKTPEGTFYIAENSVLNPADQYLGTRWMRVSYPNIEDAQRGIQSGLIDRATYQQIVNAINNKQIPPQYTALGGGVGIHGGSNNGINSGNSWTWGCMALTNSNVNEIFDYIPQGTKLVIRY